MFGDVVAAIDGSPASFRAAKMGAEMAATSGGALELVAVVPPRTGLASLRPGGGEAEVDRRAADVRSALVMVGGTVPVRRAEVVEGPIVDRILEACGEAPGGRLIAVGSGRSRVRLGSVSSAVLRHASCPVLVVREGTTRSPHVQRILVGFDGTEGAWAAVDAAAELSVRTGAEVHLVWVLKPSFPMPPRGMPLATGEMQALAGEPERRELEAAADRVRARGGRVARTLFELGRPADRLLARAEEVDVDLVIVGARGERSPGTRRMLGGVSDRVVASSTRPVLVIK